MEQKFFDIHPKLEELGAQVEQACAEVFARTDAIG